MNRSIRATLVSLLAVVALIFGGVVLKQVNEQNREPEPAPDLSDIGVYVYDEPKELYAFSLTNQQGRTVTPSNLEGRWTFAFVGYTRCPDICPATMGMMRRLDQKISSDLPNPEYLLISADPSHDTPERLRDYVRAFGKNFHGFTGDKDELRSLAESMNATFTEPDQSRKDMVDHSGHLTLINPEGEMVAVIQPPHKPEAIAEAFETIYEWAQSRHARAGS